MDEANESRIEERRSPGDWPAPTEEELRQRRVAEFRSWLGSMKGSVTLLKGDWTDPLDPEDYEPSDSDPLRSKE